MFDEERASIDAMLSTDFALLDRVALEAVAVAITGGGQEEDGGLLQARMLLSDMEALFSSVSAAMLQPHVVSEEHLMLTCKAGPYTMYFSAKLQLNFNLAR